MKTYWLSPLVLGLALAGGAQAQRFPNLGNINLNPMTAVNALKPISEKEEIDIGRDLAGRLLGQVQLVNDANVQAYVNRVGRWVATQSERPDLDRKSTRLNSSHT